MSDDERIDWGSAYGKRVAENILPLSYAAVAPEALCEWVFTGDVTDYLTPTEECFFCSKPEGLRYHFDIHNIKTNMHLLTGSSCIKKVRDYVSVFDEHRARVPPDSVPGYLDKLERDTKKRTEDGIYGETERLYEDLCKSDFINSSAQWALKLLKIYVGNSNIVIPVVRDIKDIDESLPVFKQDIVRFTEAFRVGRRDREVREKERIAVERNRRAAEAAAAALEYERMRPFMEATAREDAAKAAAAVDNAQAVRECQRECGVVWRRMSTGKWHVDVGVFHAFVCKASNGKGHFLMIENVLTKNRIPGLTRATEAGALRDLRGALEAAKMYLLHVR